MSQINRPSPNGNGYLSSYAFYYNPEQAPCDKKIIDLNEILSEALQRFEMEREKGLLVVRFDHLPQIMVDKQIIFGVFVNLLEMIIRHSPVDCNLFLYIKCEAVDTDTINLSVEKGYNSFEIRFVTNFIANKPWQDLYHQKLEEISTIISFYKGSFICNKSINTGCLFSLNLPGKFSS